MTRYLLDTGIAGAFTAKRDPVFSRVRDETRKGNVIGICVPVLGELYYGVENSTSHDRSLRELRLALPLLRIWPFTTNAAEEFGRLAALLQRIGRPMQQIDVMIAAIALTLGNTTVVSSDSDLAAVPGHTVENWATP